MRWFGERWQGEVCDLPQVENPGGACYFCKEPIAPEDQGFAFDFGACHKKCLSRAIKGKTWVDHTWKTYMPSMWTRVWECIRCGVVVSHDPKTKEGREKNLRDGRTEDCTGHLVDAVSNL